MRVHPWKRVVAGSQCHERVRYSSEHARFLYGMVSVLAILVSATRLLGTVAVEEGTVRLAVIVWYRPSHSFLSQA
jgi:hypothetical protein